MTNQFKVKRGFTLIELLVVMTIIAILVASATASWRNAQIKGRDGKRKSDLKGIQQVLENYFQTRGNYPNAGITWVEAYDSASGSSSWLGRPGELVPQYVSALPHDPVNSGANVYLYCVPANHLRYVMAASLENTNDPELNSSPLSECSGSGWTFNYWVTNP